MKQDEVITGQKYLFVNNGNIEHKKEFYNQVATVLKRIKGKENKKAFHRNKRGKKPDKYWLDIGCYANASNLKLLTFKND
jgi:hypothetical protein